MMLKRSHTGEHETSQLSKRAKSGVGNIYPNNTASTTTPSPRARFQKKAEIRRIFLPKRCNRYTDTSIFTRMESDPRLSTGAPLAPPASTWPTNFSNASTLNLPSLKAPANTFQSYMQPNNHQQLACSVPYYGLYNPSHFNLYQPHLWLCNYPNYQMSYQAPYI